MKFDPSPFARWEASPHEAQQIQQDLRAAVSVQDDFAPLTRVAGVEIAHSRFNDVITVAVALVRYPDLTLLERHVVTFRTRFPFVAELLSFREAPAVLAALERLSQRPDLVMVGGPGVAHGRGVGVASHVGVVAGLPTIGCAKSASVGSYVEPEVNAGSTSALVWQGEIIGIVYRSKNRVAPLFISAGHRVSRETAARLVREACHGYRLPEPLRQASAALVETKHLTRTSAEAG